MEGLAPQIKGEYEKSFEDQSDLVLKPFVRYGFSNNHLNGKLSMIKEPWRISGGTQVSQFNTDNPISGFLNTDLTLFDGRNFMKIYEETFAKAGFSKEIGNGWYPELSVKWSRRHPLQNTTDYAFVKKEKREFTPNVPQHPYFKRNTFEKHEAFIAEVGLNIKPGQKYMTVKGEKINLGTQWPTFKLNYKRAIPGILGSDAHYSLAEIRIEDAIDLNLFGNLNIKGSAGRFLSKNNIPFIDYRHFNGQEIIYQLQSFSDFQLLDYYEASTVNTFAETHLEHQFNGFIWNKLPLLKKLKWQIIANGNFLYQKGEDIYWEWGVGIGDIIKIAGSRSFRVSYFQSYTGTSFNSQGIRLGMDLSSLIGD